MKAIETEYGGYKFRSRLEARWAVFFDACGVKWEYEPEGYNLGDGIYYLPDFLLHDVFFRDSDKPNDLWVEVKGQMTAADAKKILKFADLDVDELTVKNPILIVTNLPDADAPEDYMRDLAYEGEEPYPFNFALIDGDWFGAFPFINKKGRLVIADDNDRCFGGYDYNATTKAYRLARQSRFEHGENPSQNLSAKPIYLFPSLNGIIIDILSVNGMPQYFVKAARIFSAITGKDEAISANHPLIQAAEAIGATWFRFITQRLSGGNSYGRKGFYFAVDDVPQILLQYVEHNYRPKTQRQELYNQEALKLRKWFMSEVIPMYGKR